MRAGINGTFPDQDILKGWLKISVQFDLNWQLIVKGCKVTRDGGLRDPGQCIRLPPGCLILVDHNSANAFKEVMAVKDPIDDPELDLHAGFEICISTSSELLMGDLLASRRLCGHNAGHLECPV